MDQKELDALPETGGIGQTEKVINGKRVIVPVELPGLALWEAVDVVGTDGRRWLVGTASGKKWKRALPSYGRDWPDGDIGVPILIATFAAGLKAHLREVGNIRRLADPEFWDGLDAAIDAFAAEFQRGK